VVELLRFEELLRTYVFIGKIVVMIPIPLVFKPHNLFGKSFGFRRAISNHVLWALHGVFVRTIIRAVCGLILALSSKHCTIPPFALPVYAATLLVHALEGVSGLIVDVQGLLVFRAAVVLGDGVS